MESIADTMREAGRKIEIELERIGQRITALEEIVGEDWVPSPNPEPDPEPPSSLQSQRLWIWREGSSAEDYGVKDSVVCAPSGTAGAHDVRIIYRAGEKTTSAQAMLSRTLDAKRSGASAVVVDIESYFIREGSGHAATVYRECGKILPFYYAPKLFLDHFKRHWDMEFSEAARFMNDNSDGLVAWYYGEDSAEEWIKHMNRIADHGYTKHIVPLGDFAKRTSGGAATSPWGAGAIEKFHRNGWSVGVFMPSKNNWPSYVMKSPAWKKAVELY